MSTLITGARSGLGKFLTDKYGTVGYTRQTAFATIEGNHYDLIVHCAFNTRNNPASNQLREYFQDNIILTHNLLKRVTCDRFVFISSIDVYPSDFDFKHEEVNIDINEVPTIYGQCKLACEDMVSHHPNYLILRCGGIIGPNKIPRSIQTALERGMTSLHPNSTVNYVHQQTIFDIIQTPNVCRQIVNVASDISMPIIDLEEIVYPLSFGGYEYHATRVVTSKLKNLFPNVKIPPSKRTLLSVLNST